MSVEGISIIIPAYNEELRVKRVLESYLDFFNDKKIDFEIILIVNNSSDKTFVIAEKLAKQQSNLKVYNLPFYTGKGGAVINGFLKAKKSLIGFVDADESTSPKEFFKLLINLNDFDAIIGSRSLPESEIKISQSRIRTFLGNGYRQIVKLLFGFDFEDTQCGAKIFKKKAFDLIKDKIKTNEWAFDVELLWLLKKQGFRIKEFPIEWNDSDESKFNFLAIPKMFFDLIKIRFF